MVERTGVLVVGGSQAGLTAGYYLKNARIPFLILDAAAGVGDAWRSRWDSLELFTVARYSSLPGLRFPGDPEHFPGKDEVADYLEEYARSFELPVRRRSRATSLEKADGGYRVTAGSQTCEADQVIVATGAYQRPHVPELAGRLDGEVTQLHTAEYRNPRQLPPGEVLVVGGANSGAQIAEELSATRRVRLARGRKPLRLPRRILGKSLHWWGEHLGVIRAPLGRIRDPKKGGDLLIGTSYRELADRYGIEFLARATDAGGRTVTCADGRSVEVTNVVWATGFRSDYSWIHVPVLDDDGLPIHRRGVTTADGLYFLGMHFQHSLGSSLIGFVRHDARFLIERIKRTR
jgi:putative flavoprotein involved in K+ transport